VLSVYVRNRALLLEKCGFRYTLPIGNYTVYTVHISYMYSCFVYELANEREQVSREGDFLAPGPSAKLYRLNFFK